MNNDQIASIDLTKSAVLRRVMSGASLRGVTKEVMKFSNDAMLTVLRDSDVDNIVLKLSYGALAGQKYPKVMRRSLQIIVLICAKL